MLPDARDSNFQTDDISTIKQLVLWNCLQMNTIPVFQYEEARRFSDGTCLIFEISLFVEVDYSKILMLVLYSRSLQNVSQYQELFSSNERSTRVSVLTVQLTNLSRVCLNLKTKLY